MNARSLNIVLVLVSLFAIKASLSENIEEEDPRPSWLREPWRLDPGFLSVTARLWCPNNCRPICEALRAKHNKAKSRVLALLQHFGRSRKGMRSWRTTIVEVPNLYMREIFDRNRRCSTINQPCRCRLEV